MAKVINRFMMINLGSFADHIATISRVISDPNLSYEAVGVYIVMLEKLREYSSAVCLNTIYEHFNLDNRQRLRLIDSLFLLEANDYVDFHFETDSHNTETAEDFWIAERAKLCQV